jgi:hypothetical protein
MILSIVASLSGLCVHYETNAIPSIVRAKWPQFEKGTVPTQRFKPPPPEVSRRTLKSAVALAKASRVSRVPVVWNLQHGGAPLGPLHICVLQMLGEQANAQ